MARAEVAYAQKKAQQDAATLIFLDESGFYLLPGRVRTYAPCGQTPCLRPFQTRDHLSVIGAITPAGHLYTRIHPRAITSVDIVGFLQHLLRFHPKVLVIWDGSPIHKGAVRTYLRAGGSQRIHLERLPPYAPELNPTEGIWQQLKHVELRNVCCEDLGQLRAQLSLAIRRLRRRSPIIQACFEGAQLS